MPRHGIGDLGTHFRPVVEVAFAILHFPPQIRARRKLDVLGLDGDRRADIRTAGRIGVVRKPTAISVQPAFLRTNRNQGFPLNRLEVQGPRLALTLSFCRYIARASTFSSSSAPLDSDHTAQAKGDASQRTRRFYF
jgi:hypothetical protein